MEKYQQNGIINLIVILVMLSLVGCGSEKPAPETTSNETTNANQKAERPNYASTFTMAVEKNYPPYVLQDEFGKVSGFDVDLMKAIADESKFNIQFIIVDRKQSFKQLAEGKYNIFGSGVGINDERMTNFYISDSYMTSAAAFATSDKTITDEKSLSGKIIARQPANYYYDKVDSNYASSNKFMEVPTTFMAYAETAKDTNIITIDDVHVINYIKNSYKNDADIPEISVYPAFKGEEKQIAFVIEKGNGDLLNKVNDGLEAVIANGKFDEIYNKWFTE